PSGCSYGATPRHPAGGVGPFETGRELRPPPRRLVSRGGTHAGGRGAPGAAARTGPGPATLSANALLPTTPLDRRAAPCLRRQPAGSLALPLRRLPRVSHPPAHHRVH